MKLTFYALSFSLAASCMMLLTSCVQTQETQNKKPPVTTDKLIAKAIKEKPPEPAQLPVRFQTPGYLTVNPQVDEGAGKDDTLEYEIKVGANIRSTKGPQPLWDIMKRLASLKGMSVSWASDVDQNVLVDVDISAGDGYSEAIDNLLRQVDYYHEVKGSTIIIKYKETKVYHVAMPFTKQLFETATGGNVLGSGDETSSVEGTIRLDSKNNEFDIWKNIQENLDAIIETWSTTETGPEVEAAASTVPPKEGEKTVVPAVEAPTRQTSTGGNSYTIDKPVGLITVNAPRPLQKRIEDYLENVKREIYKQVTIEAKIIEVQLTDNSTLGIDWNLLLRSLSFGGNIGFGKGYDKSKNKKINDVFTNKLQNSVEGNRVGSSSYSRSSESSGKTTSNNDDGTRTNASEGITINSDSSKGSGESTITTTSLDKSELVSTAKFLTDITGNASNLATGSLSLATFNFANFLHALSEQGNTTILANPKLSVMNGQPALITVGRNVTYIDNIEANVSTGNNPIVTYSVDTERILSGVGLTLTPVIRDNNEIIMNLVPVTSVLEEPIEYRQIGGGTEVGLPIINLREMSTMVKVKDGEMLVIGGLISTVESKEGNNLFPGLADVPVLKYLTGYETKKMIKRELIILLRPRIL